QGWVGDGGRARQAPRPAGGPAEAARRGARARGGAPGHRPPQRLRMKRVIVNADDLGRTPGINRGVFEAHRRGIVTSASLMVNYPAARDVPALSAETPGLGIGLHVALTGGVPTLPAERIRSLVDGRGRLPSRPSGLEDADPAEVLAEVRAQVKRFRE